MKKITVAMIVMIAIIGLCSCRQESRDDFLNIMNEMYVSTEANSEIIDAIELSLFEWNVTPYYSKKVVVSPEHLIRIDRLYPDIDYFLEYYATTPEGKFLDCIMSDDKNIVGYFGTFTHLSSKEENTFVVFSTEDIDDDFTPAQIVPDPFGTMTLEELFENEVLLNQLKESRLDLSKTSGRCFGFFSSIIDKPFIIFFDGEHEYLICPGGFIYTQDFPWSVLIPSDEKKTFEFDEMKLYNMNELTPFFISEYETYKKVRDEEDIKAERNNNSINEDSRTWQYS